MTSNTPDFAELAAANGIELDRGEALVNTSGADADWFSVAATDKSGRHWILQAPKRGDVLISSRYEAQVLAFVKGKTGVAVPDWKVHTDKLVAYPMLSGQPAAQSDPLMGDFIWRTPSNNGVFLNSLAIALVRLHDIEARDAAAAGLRVSNAAQVRQAIRTQMDDAKALSPVPEVLWKLWERWLYDDSFWPSTTGLINGDLYPQHLLVRSDNELVGIEDWADAEVGDIARDFTPVFSALGREAMEDLMLRYARAGGNGWPRMADHAEMYYWAGPLRYAAYAMRTGVLSDLMGVKAIMHRYASMLEDSGLS
jgi:macrolide phosphotransferase